MTPFKENFVTDAKGNKIAVQLSIKDYNKILEELEDIEDIKAYDKAVNRKLEFTPLNQVIKEIEAVRKKKK